MLSTFAIAAICLVAPVSGPVVSDYAPSGRYAGHWGVDYAASVGDPVRAPVSGVVTFAGSVAGMRSVTISPVPGLKVSVSYLSEVSAISGAYVRRGSVIGEAGTEHGVPAVHLSTRVDGEYVDPKTRMGCRPTDITRALRLVEPPQPYARRRAHRNPGRDLRSHPHRTSARR